MRNTNNVLLKKDSIKQANYLWSHVPPCDPDEGAIFFRLLTNSLWDPMVKPDQTKVTKHIIIEVERIATPICA